MICKDCLHYEVCAEVMKQQLYIKEKVCKQKPVCSQFADRSEWEHLPCKVEDILYFVKNNTDACCPVCDMYDGYDNYCHLKQNYYPDLAEIPICDKQFMEIVECKADLITIVENIDNFGKTVFLTREEAEKALKE